MSVGVAARMRLAPQPGEVLDRGRSLWFSWNGDTYAAYAGDTIVSALAAAGERIFSRSFKYHRPRGVLTASFLDPGCIVRVGDEPNVRGAHRRVEAGMVVRAQNVWPSLRFDAKAANQALGRFLEAGFYYKTFIRPRSLWPTYERILRRFAAGGVVADGPAGGYYDKRYAHPDVVVAGGGPAGMAAAVAAAEVGARVLLVEEEHELGGHLRWGNTADLAMLGELRALVAGAEGVEVMTDAAVTGRYDGNWVAILQRGLPHVTERLVKARAKTLVVAPGLVERPYVFAGNDTPGVMLSTAVRRLINLYAVRPGDRAVVLAANADGDAAATDLDRAGVDVARVLDGRRGGDDVVRVRGGGSVRAVECGDGTTVDCDLLVTAVGWTAPTSLLNMAGDRPTYRPEAARFFPGRLPDDVLATGGITGDGSLEALVDRARATGREAARRALALRAPAVEIPDLPVDPHPELFFGRTDGIVDYSEDVTARDLIAAVAEGYDAIELAKRYTTVTMGPTQGKLETVNAVAIVAAATGSTMAETGTTVWRPPYSPITLGALAGRNLEPVRYSPIQPWHEEAGAKPLVAGAWIRPDHYGDPAEEVLNVRHNVGIIDVTPLGKFDLRGPDVPRLLNLLYVNKWSALDVGRVRYGVMCADDGVVLDDGVTGRLGPERYMMTTTSSGADSVGEWIESWLQTEHPDWRVHVEQAGHAYASINVAGPRCRDLLARVVEGIDLSDAAFGYMRVRTGRVAGVDCFAWRIGFTGELSYEVHVPAAYGLYVWEALLEAGADLGVGAFGVEAQRILRLEAGHLIVGQDTDGLTQAYGAGLDWAVKLDKDDFVGKPELAWQSQCEDYPRLVGLQPVDGSVVPDEGSQIVEGASTIVGRITSSRRSPTLERSICLGFVAPHLAAPGTTVTVLLPDRRRVPATVTAKLAHVRPKGDGPAPAGPAGGDLKGDGPAPAGPAGGDLKADGPAPASGWGVDPRGDLAEHRVIARSPIRPAPPVTIHDGWEVSARRSSAGLRIADCTPLTKVRVRASGDGGVAQELGVGHRRATRDGRGWLTAGTGPGEWLILAPPGTAVEVRAHVEAMEDDGLVSVFDATHGRALVRVTGAEAATLLAKVCAVDVSDHVTPDAAAFRTEVAALVTEVIRDDRGGDRSYLLCCERSSGQSLFDALLDAGAEFAADVDGFEES